MHRPLRLMTCRTERGSSCHSLTDPSGPQTGPSLSFLRTTQDSWKFNLEREQGQGQGFGAKSTGPGEGGSHVLRDCRLPPSCLFQCSDLGQKPSSFLASVSLSVKRDALASSWSRSEPEPRKPCLAHSHHSESIEGYLYRTSRTLFSLCFIFLCKLSNYLISEKFYRSW